MVLTWQLTPLQVRRKVSSVVVSTFIEWALRWVVTAAVIVTGVAASVRAAASEAQTPVTLTDLLARSARYVAYYQERLSSVVAEERYEQRVESKISGSFGPFGTTRGSSTDLSRRRLMSDYLLVKAPGQSGWVPFRDVYEVDGQAVRDRDERLARLFVDSPATAWDQAAAIAEESSRFNIGTVSRTINVPTLALIFLTGEHQPRFEFSHEETRGTGSTETWVVAYRERRRPTLIRGQGGADLPAFGTFWIDVNEGRVLQSLVRTDDGDLRSEIEATYQLDSKLGLWVPIEMQEQYRTGAGETIEGTATYGHFRQFNVATFERIR